MSYRFTAAQLRAHLRQYDEILEKDPNGESVRRIALNIADGFEDNELAELAKAIPLVVSRFASSGIAPSRDALFDRAVMLFIGECYERIKRREVLEARVAANANLSASECKAMVLRAVYNIREHAWAGELVEELGLSDQQGVEALEELEYEGAIEGTRVRSTEPNTDLLWRVKISVRGRLMAENRFKADGGASVNINNTFGPGANVANAGQAHDVTQHISTILPRIPPDVRAVLEETVNGREYVETFEEGVRSKQPNFKFLRSLASTMKTTVEAANATTEVMAHAHEWSATVAHVVSQLHI